MRFNFVSSYEQSLKLLSDLHSQAERLGRNLPYHPLVTFEKFIEKNKELIYEIACYSRRDPRQIQKFDVNSIRKALFDSFLEGGECYRRVCEMAFGDPDDLTCEADVYEAAELEGARVVCALDTPDCYLVSWSDDYYVVCDCNGWWACRVSL